MIVKKITRDELKARLRDSEDIVFVEMLEPKYYKEAQLPVKTDAHKKVDGPDGARDAGGYAMAGPSPSSSTSARYAAAAQITAAEILFIHRRTTPSRPKRARAKR
jgi:hypothetical protein